MEKNNKGFEDLPISEDLEGEDYSDNYLTLEMEDGTKQDFIVLDIFEYQGSEYIALADKDSLQYDILSMNHINDEEVDLEFIDDENKFNEIADWFEKLYFSAEEEPED
ncbi:MAG: DUF1292 domain-containing protein [Candidatus Cloacimonadaceae bacterium]|jgi:hypothetical protein|nr:DUF1292 domain-containing protein [Candidatus Cloacimonadota bacterium]MCB5258487.1 DUF1292 domain-containing protein [Candidatus Cloacimonadota bacterium]MDD5624736.1 DUF1292 domain-containing protein [Candidatus Cloacimonadota bacterium]MDY0111674.1 DUF1292 domain-containing protein [Candidatus Syntrophosphaera sp.]